MFLNQLDENAARSLRVNEGHPMPGSAGPPLLVNKANAPRLERLKRGINIRHGKGDMVHPLTALGDEARHTAVIVERFNELKQSLPARHKGDFHPLLVDSLTVGDLKPEESLIQGGGCVDIFDG
jgi:hypothetical protein